MPLLDRKKQLSGVLQTSSALATGLDLAANASIFVQDLTADIEPENITRNLLSDTITPTKDLIGQKIVSMSFGVEMKGTPLGTHAAGAPVWGRYAQACGMEEVEVQALTIGSITASGSGSSTTFRHNEIVTGGTSGATARVIADWHDGALKILIDKASITGTPANEQWTGGDSGAQATSTGLADAGFAWAPVTDAVKTIKFDGIGLKNALQVGDAIEGATSGAIGVVTEAASVSTDTVVKFRSLRGAFSTAETLAIIAPAARVDTDIGDLAADPEEQFIQAPPISLKSRLDGTALEARGARGNLVVNLEVNRQARLDFTFRGVLNSSADAALIAGIQYDNGNPPLFESSAIGFSKNDALVDMQTADEITPCLRNVTLDIGNQLAERKCAGAANGLLDIFVADRQGTGSMDPEHSLEADTAWLTALQDGRVSRLSMTVGGTLGNMFEIRVPGIQFTGVSSSEAEGIATKDIAFKLTGGDLFDLDSAATVNSSIGGNNELILIYYTS